MVTEITPFKNRVRELDALNDLAAKKTAQMLVLYGRRRIGKTSLLKHWCAPHESPSFYWTGYRTTSEILLKSFTARLISITPGATEGTLFANWEAALVHLFKLAEKKTVIAVIDEFPYLVEMEPSIPSLLQRLWDEQKDKSRLVLALCGSHFHMMHEEFASSRRPLYGRTSRTMILDEIEPKDLQLFLPRYSPEQIVETYSVTGGVPAYLELWDDQRPVMHNIRELFLRSATFFSQEAILLIQDEISEPRTYLGILQAIGGGLKTPKQIATATGLHLSHLGKYLHTLVNLRFVRRVLSEDSENRHTSRNSKYEIRDPYLRFHFQFLYPYPDRRQFDGGGWLAEEVTKNFPSFVGKTAYEELARQHIQTLGNLGQLSFSPQYVGRAWSKQAEIDIAAINWQDRTIFFGECKWTATKMTLADLESLKKRAAKLTKLKDFTPQYALCSKSGFAAELLRNLPNDTRLFAGGAFTEATD